VKTVVWVIYTALVVLAPIVLPSSNPVVVMAVVLVAAVGFHPIRRDVERAAKRRFDHRRRRLEKMPSSYRSMTGNLSQLLTN
jgi:hypothetical protein